jgi:hypothetical protein
MAYIPPPEPESAATRRWRSLSTGEWVTHPKGTRPQFPPRATRSALLVHRVSVDHEGEGEEPDTEDGRRG